MLISSGASEATPEELRNGGAYCGGLALVAVRTTNWHLGYPMGIYVLRGTGPQRFGPRRPPDLEPSKRMGSWFCAFIEVNGTVQFLQSRRSKLPFSQSLPRKTASNYVPQTVLPAFTFVFVFTPRFLSSLDLELVLILRHGETVLIRYPRLCCQLLHSSSFSW
jgi:hypothetical protein